MGPVNTSLKRKLAGVYWSSYKISHLFIKKDHVLTLLPTLFGSWCERESDVSDVRPRVNSVNHNIVVYICGSALKVQFRFVSDSDTSYFVNSLRITFLFHCSVDVFRGKC